MLSLTPAPSGREDWEHIPSPQGSGRATFGSRYALGPPTCGQRGRCYHSHTRGQRGATKEGCWGSSWNSSYPLSPVTDSPRALGQTQGPAGTQRDCEPKWPPGLSQVLNHSPWSPALCQARGTTGHGGSRQETGPPAASRGWAGPHRGQAGALSPRPWHTRTGHPSPACCQAPAGSWPLTELWETVWQRHRPPAGAPTRSLLCTDQHSGLRVRVHANRPTRVGHTAGPDRAPSPSLSPWWAVGGLARRGLFPFPGPAVSSPWQGAFLRGSSQDLLEGGEAPGGELPAPPPPQAKIPATAWAPT